MENTTEFWSNGLGSISTRTQEAEDSGEKDVALLLPIPMQHNSLSSVPFVVGSGGRRDLCFVAGPVAGVEGRGIDGSRGHLQQGRRTLGAAVLGRSEGPVEGGPITRGSGTGSSRMQQDNSNDDDKF